MSNWCKRTAVAAKHEREFELMDTGIFDENRYFDVFIEYAKADAEDILVRITVANRGPEAARSARAADGLVPQHMVLVRGCSEALAEAVQPDACRDRAR